MRWVIVDKNTLEVASMYESEASKQAEFGGPWGDSNRFMHLQVPEDVTSPSVVVSYEQDVVDVEFVECRCAQNKPVFKPAYDGEGRLMIDPDGAPLYAKLYERVEVLGMVYKIRPL